LEAACSFASETGSKDLCFHFDDSRDLVFAGWTLEDDVSLIINVLLFEDLLRAFKGAAEQLATAIAGIFNLRPERRKRNDLSPQISENTQFILFLCFTKFLYALYSFMVYLPIMRFTLLSISSIKSSARWSSLS
jgi:hypothetical protein